MKMRKMIEIQYEHTATGFVVEKVHATHAVYNLSFCKQNYVIVNFSLYEIS